MLFRSQSTKMMLYLERTKGAYFRGSFLIRAMGIFSVASGVLQSDEGECDRAGLGVDVPTRLRFGPLGFLGDQLRHSERHFQDSAGVCGLFLAGWKKSSILSLDILALRKICHTPSKLLLHAHPRC